jgi:hypothetical protein
MLSLPTHGGAARPRTPGSAGWVSQKLLVEQLLGWQRQGTNFPCRPSYHRGPGFDLRYRLGATTYAIAIRAPASADAVTPTSVRVISPGRNIALVDDGGRHDAMLTVWRAASRAHA